MRGVANIAPERTTSTSTPQKDTGIEHLTVFSLHTKGCWLTNLMCCLHIVESKYRYCTCAHSVCPESQIKPSQFYLCNVKSQQKWSHDTFQIEHGKREGKFTQGLKILHLDIKGNSADFISHDIIAFFFHPLITLDIHFVQVPLTAPVQALDPSRAHSTGPNPAPSLANQPLPLRKNREGGLKKIWDCNTHYEWLRNIQADVYLTW